jgi:glycosyltransferase involved in cell wall biosynthesis
MSANASSFPLPSRLSQPAPPRVAILIPAHEPGETLEYLIDSLIEAEVPAIIVVDDGSRAMHRRVFERIAHLPSVHVLRQTQDRGKGMALKTGMRYFLEHFSHYTGLVTMDAEGQHCADDVLRVARTLHKAPRLAILGARSFSGLRRGDLKGRISRSRLLGNRLMAFLFRAFTGVPLSDAQTGLRGLPTSLLPRLLDLPGSRYEYEMAMLLHIARSGHPLAEQPVRMVSDAENAGSQFRPVIDSARVICAMLTARQPQQWTLEVETTADPMPDAKGASQPHKLHAK